jgi:topoisomerase IA-like protein
MKVTNLTDAAPHPALVARMPISVGAKHKIVVEPGQTVDVTEEEAERLMAHFRHHLVVGELPEWYVEAKPAPAPKKAPAKKATKKKASKKKAK